MHATAPRANVRPSGIPRLRYTLYIGLGVFLVVQVVLFFQAPDFTLRGVSPDASLWEANKADDHSGSTNGRRGDSDESGDSGGGGDSVNADPLLSDERSQALLKGPWQRVDEYRYMMGQRELKHARWSSSDGDDKPRRPFSERYNRATGLIDSDKSEKSDEEEPLDKVPASIVWDFGACGCTGWGIECINMVLPLREKVEKLGIIASEGCFCPGFPTDEVAALEQMRKEPIPTWDTVDVFVSHKPPSRFPIFPYDGDIYIEKPPRYLVGRSMTETDRIPQHWVNKVNQVDELWVPSTFVADAYIRSGVDASIVHVIPEPVDTKSYDPEQVVPLKALDRQRSRFNFLSMFKWEDRKGWRVLLRAFFEEFSPGDDVSLFIQTYHYGSMEPHDPTGIENEIRQFVRNESLREDMLPFVKILAKELSMEEVPMLFKAADAFVLPTRGEGWGLPIIEAMAMGLPTIATNWSGQIDFMHADNAYPLRVEKLVPSWGGNFASDLLWAEPSLSHLRSLMREVSRTPDHAPFNLRARKARRDVLENYNREVIARTVQRRIAEILKLLDAT